MNTTKPVNDFTFACVAFGMFSYLMIAAFVLASTSPVKSQVVALAPIEVGSEMPYGKAGNWHVAVRLDGHRFIGCVASIDKPENIRAELSINNTEAILKVTGAQFGLTKNEPALMQIDDVTPWATYARMVDVWTTEFVLPTSADSLFMVKKGASAKLVAGGKRLDISLDGTGRAIDLMLDCKAEGQEVVDRHTVESAEPAYTIPMPEDVK